MEGKEKKSKAPYLGRRRKKRKRRNHLSPAEKPWGPPREEKGGFYRKRGSRRFPIGVER